MLLIGEKPKRRQGIVRLKAYRQLNPVITRLNKVIGKHIHAMTIDIEEIVNKQIGISEKYEQLWAAMKHWEDYFREIGDSQSRYATQELFRKSGTFLIEQLSSKIGVDVNVMFDDREFAEIIDSTAVAAASSISDIPKQFIGKVVKAVIAEAKQQQLPEGRTLWQELKRLGGWTIRRSQLMARELTAKTHSAISKEQQRQAGIEKYEWRTSEDERVVGNPSGLYPKPTLEHGNHYKRNRKIFRWDKPPSDGHPGEAVGCRCIAVPVIDLGKI